MSGVRAYMMIDGPQVRYTSDEQHVSSQFLQLSVLRCSLTESILESTDLEAL